MRNSLFLTLALALAAACSSGTSETRSNSLAANGPGPGTQQAWGPGGNSAAAGTKSVDGVASNVRSNGLTVQGTALTVDSQTQILRAGAPAAEGMSAIREGDQVRASYDPAGNRALRIEVGPGTPGLQQNGAGAPDPKGGRNEGNDPPSK